MKLSKYFCPYCEGVRLEFREVPSSAPDGVESAHKNEIVLGCPLAKYTGCPDTTGACATEAEAESSAAQTCQTLPGADSESQYADHFKNWLQGASPVETAYLCLPAQPQPIFVFRLPGFIPAECSYEANSAEEAIEMLVADAPEGFVAEWRKATGNTPDVLLPEGRGPQVETLGFQAMQRHIECWADDPTTDLYHEGIYPQHHAYLTAYQAAKEEAWEQTRSAHKENKLKALRERANAAGASVEVMSLLEDLQAKNKRLVAAITALVDGGTYEKGAQDCDKVLRTKESV